MDDQVDAWHELLVSLDLGDVINLSPAETMWRARNEILRLRSSRNEVIEMCAATADEEEELDGDMPDELHLIPVEDVARAAVRVTKKNIASAIRSLKDHSNG